MAPSEIEPRPQGETTVRVPDPVWDPRAALQSLVLESALDDHDQRAATSRILREHALIAASSVCHLAVYASSERTRLQAAQYVVDRALLTSKQDHTPSIKDEQVQMIGSALQSAVRSLGHRYGFDANDAHVRSVVHAALSQVSSAAPVETTPQDPS